MPFLMTLAVPWPTFSFEVVLYYCGETWCKWPPWDLWRVVVWKKGQTLYRLTELSQNYSPLLTVVIGNKANEVMVEQGGGNNQSLLQIGHVGLRFGGPLV